jgi:hypothetical protein
MAEKTWDELKKGGSEHYKTGGVEPIDLYRAKGILKSFGLGSITKYAARNMDQYRGDEKFIEDMNKIIHYAELLKACVNEISAKALYAMPAPGTVREYMQTGGECCGKISA